MVFIHAWCYTYQLYSKELGQLSRYRLTLGWTVRGSNPGGDEIFSSLPDWPWGPPSLLYNGYWIFSRDKRPGCGFDHPPPSSAEVNKRVELYLYSPSGPSWPVRGWTLPLPLPLPVQQNTSEHWYSESQDLDTNYSYTHFTYYAKNCMLNIQSVNQMMTHKSWNV